MEEGDLGPSRTFADVRDDEEYTLTVQETADMFAAAGIPRSERAIQKYCKRRDLKCVPADTLRGSKYLISRESVERLIIQKRQAQQFAEQIPEPEYSRTFENVRERSRPDEKEVRGDEQLGKALSDSERGPAVDAEGDEDARAAIKKLQEENLGLKIDNAGKQAFISQLVSERQQLMAATQELSYKLGAAETRVLHLEAPGRTRIARTVPLDTSDTQRPASPDGGVVEEPIPTPTVVQATPPPPTAEEPKRSLFGRMFGGQ